MAAAAKFILVLFVDDTGQTKSIDIIPAKWISYDEVQDHLVTPFISNCSKANLRVLKDLVQSEAEPLQSWDLRRISIRGSATSYAEAEKKIQNLSKQSFVFTTGNEEHAKEKEREITKKYKLKGNKYNKMDVEDLFAASAFDACNQASTKTKVKQKKLNEPANAKKKNSSKKKVDSGKASTSLQQPSVRYPRNHLPNSQTGTSNNEHSHSENDASEESEDNPSIYAPDDHSDGEINAEMANRRCPPKKSNPAESFASDSGSRDDNNNVGYNRGLSALRDPKQKTEGDDHNQLRKTGNSNIPTGALALDVQDSDDTKTVVLKCYRRLSAQIGQLQTQLTDMKLRQTEMVSVVSELSTKRIEKITGIDSTIDKYGLGELPFKTLEEFKEFDTKVKSNKSIRNEITNGITALVNSDVKYLTKSTRDIIQRFMTRDVLLNFTAVRQSGAKIIFKEDTTFYLCIRDAVLSKCDTNITEKRIHDAIGVVINNAKDWDGHRQIRKKAESQK